MTNASTASHTRPDEKPTTEGIPAFWKVSSTANPAARNSRQPNTEMARTGLLDAPDRAGKLMS